MLGVLLTGIVFMQVEVLKLGANVGRSVNLVTELQSKNQRLRAWDTSLSSPQRIMQLASRMGMVMPAPTEVAFVSARVSPGKAISRITSPDRTSFITQLAAEQTADGDPITATTPQQTVSPQQASTSSSSSTTDAAPATSQASAPTSAGGATTLASSGGGTLATGSQSTATQSPPSSATDATAAAAGPAAAGGTPATAASGAAAGTAAVSDGTSAVGAPTGTGSSSSSGGANLPAGQ